MALGRISGPLLKANLLREGVDLAFETDLLYLDVNNSRIGINTATPEYDLDVNGTTRAPNLIVRTEADIASINFLGNRISTSAGTLTLGTGDNVIYQKRLTVDSFDIEDNVISTNTTNADIELAPNGAGEVQIFANTNVTGNIHATGNITADGDITIGNADDDNVIFNAEIASDIIPDQTDTYSLGSDPTTGGKRWQSVYTNNLYADTISTTSLTVDGIDLSLRQGNIWYVAENGDDTYSGDHPNDPYGSVKYAIENASSGDTVHIYPGVYTEEFPITVPAGVTVKGHSLRGVKVIPASGTEYNDAFLLNGQSTVEDLTIADFYSGGNYFEVDTAVPNITTINVGTTDIAHTYVNGGTITISGTDYNVLNAVYNESTGALVITHSGGTATPGDTIFLKDLIFSCNSDTRTFPDNGYAFRFATDFEVTTRSPYIRNITVLTQGSVTSSSDPRGFDAGDAGKGAYVDGAYATTNSIEASMLFHSVTFITPGVDALTITNGARVEWLNSFTYYANRGLYAFDSNHGIARTGKTSIRVDELTGSIVAGNTFTVFETQTTETKVVTVQDVSGNDKFFIDTVQQPTLALTEGNVYIFDQSDASNAGNQLKIATTVDGAGGEYTIGVSKVGTPGTSGSYTKVVVISGSPTLHYYSSATANMGSNMTTATSNNIVVQSTIDSVDADGKFYIAERLVDLETFEERAGKTVNSNNNAALDTTIKKFGSSSLQLDGVDDYLSIDSNNDFGFGTGDFTVETWVYAEALSGTRAIADFRAGAGTDDAVFLYTASGILRVYVNGAVLLDAGTTLSLNTWYHVAVARSGSTIKLFLNGVEVDSASDSTDYDPAKPLIIGARYDGTALFWEGYIDELRVSKGVARYTTDFGLPVSEYNSDTNTSLLLHFNGVDSSTTFEDDSSNSQAIVFSNGSTAKYITLADTTDFGGELRSIASACVYGNYGAYGDGSGVLMYLISQNFAYIGTGAEDDNDVNDVIQANEVVELSGARIRYSSVDHKGDFRVGDLFYVNQEDGTVDFTSSEFNIDTTDGVSITTNGSTTTITGERIDTGNLRFAGNTISSITGDINLDSDSETVRVTSTGSLVLPAGDTASRPGTPELGMIRYNTDENIFEGYDGNWIALNGVYDLDRDTKITAELTPGANDGIIRFYIQGTETATIDADKLEVPRIEVDDISIDGNVIETIATNTDLVLSANGTGSVVIDELAFKNSSIINTTEDGILYFNQSGNGYFKIDTNGGFVVPVGTSTQRPAAAFRELGMTRYNSDQGYLEIWDGNAWVSVAGSSGAITFNAAENLAIEYVLTLG